MEALYIIFLSAESQRFLARSLLASAIASNQTYYVKTGSFSLPQSAKLRWPSNLESIHWVIWLVF